jgi:hypothetical protein
MEPPGFEACRNGGFASKLERPENPGINRGLEWSLGINPGLENGEKAQTAGRAERPRPRPQKGKQKAESGKMKIGRMPGSPEFCNFKVRWFVIPGA